METIIFITWTGKMKKLLCMLPLCALLCSSCAETPDGTIVMNEETIENFFEKDKKSWDPGLKLNLVKDQPVVAAEIPGVAPGMVRLQGSLASAGTYVFKGDEGDETRGGTIEKSVYGMLGPAGEAGNAWFYADFNPSTGEIVNARAYLYGVMEGVCDLRESVNGNYGEISPEKLALNIGGYCLFPEMQGQAMQFAIYATGRRGATFAAPFPVRYILDDTADIFSIPENPMQNKNIFDFGTGQAGITPGGNAR